MFPRYNMLCFQAASGLYKNTEMLTICCWGGGWYGRGWENVCWISLWFSVWVLIYHSVSETQYTYIYNLLIRKCTVRIVFWVVMLWVFQCSCEADLCITGWPDLTGEATTFSVQMCAHKKHTVLYFWIELSTEGRLKDFILYYGHYIPVHMEHSVFLQKTFNVLKLRHVNIFYNNSIPLPY
jgi:hypothetical protein